MAAIQSVDRTAHPQRVRRPVTLDVHMAMRKGDQMRFVVTLVVALLLIAGLLVVHAIAAKQANAWEYEGARLSKVQQVMFMAAAWTRHHREIVVPLLLIVCFAVEAFSRGRATRTKVGRARQQQDGQLSSESAPSASSDEVSS